MTPKSDLALLLNDRYAPITSTIGFIEMDYAHAVDVFAAWQHDIYRPGGLAEQAREQSTKGAVSVRGQNPDVKRVESTFRRSNVAGPLPHALEALPPLTAGSNRRYLWVPTRSGWVAYFDNFLLGTDASGPIGHLSRTHKCRGLRMMACPDTMGTKSLYDTNKRGRYGASMFTLFGPEKTEWLNVVRAISVSNSGRWSFEQTGTPQPYEEPETYKARRVRDKFPFELLDKYCRALGLRPFDEDFYLPPEQPEATLFERRWPSREHGVASDKEYTLAEVQAGVPWLPTGTPT